MVAGMSGLGKTTCIQNMLAPLMHDDTLHDGSSTSWQTFRDHPDELIMRPKHPEVKGGYKVTYAIQDTPG